MPANKALQPPIRARRRFQFAEVCPRGLRLNVKSYAESSVTHTRIARTEGQIKINITTTTGFALCCATMFEGTLNRLSEWNAFAREDADEALV